MQGRSNAINDDDDGDDDGDDGDDDGDGDGDGDDEDHLSTINIQMQYSHFLCPTLFSTMASTRRLGWARRAFSFMTNLFAAMMSTV